MKSNELNLNDSFIKLLIGIKIIMMIYGNIT